MTRNGEYIYTYTGIKFYPLDPRPEEINIIDIAHSLSRMCRYTGHTNAFYSVASHSWIMSYLVHKDNAMVALMHDATEAYLVDLPRPIKVSIPQYKDIENNLWKVIAHRFDLPDTIPDEVKEIDSRILINERNLLFDCYLSENFRSNNRWETEDKYPELDGARGAYADMMISYTKDLDCKFNSPFHCYKDFISRFANLGGGLL